MRHGRAESKSGAQRAKQNEGMEVTTGPTKQAGTQLDVQQTSAWHSSLHCWPMLDMRLPAAHPRCCSCRRSASGTAASTCCTSASGRACTPAAATTSPSSMHASSKQGPSQLPLLSATSSATVPSPLAAASRLLFSWCPLQSERSARRASSVAASALGGACTPALGAPWSGPLLLAVSMSAALQLLLLPKPLPVDSARRRAQAARASTAPPSPSKSFARLHTSIGAKWISQCQHKGAGYHPHAARVRCTQEIQQQLAEDCGRHEQCDFRHHRLASCHHGHCPTCSAGMHTPQHGTAPAAFHRARS